MQNEETKHAGRENTASKSTATGVSHTKEVTTTCGACDYPERIGYAGLPHPGYYPVATFVLCCDLLRHAPPVEKIKPKLHPWFGPRCISQRTVFGQLLSRFVQTAQSWAHLSCAGSLSTSSRSGRYNCRSNTTGPPPATPSSAAFWLSTPRMNCLVSLDSHRRLPLSCHCIAHSAPNI